jgi:hypothetical protein
MPIATFAEAGHPRTRSPSLHPRPPSGKASSFLQASAPASHGALRPRGDQDAKMCPTDVCHPNETTQTQYLARSRLAHAAFAAGRSRGVRGSARHDRGIERFSTFDSLRRTELREASLSLRSRSIEPLALLSPSFVPLRRDAPSRVFARSRRAGWEEGRSRQGPDPRHLEKDDDSTMGPECLPSAGTLRRSR